MRARSALLSLVAAATLTGSASASRAPTRTEAGAIEFAVQTFPTVGRTLRVRFTQIRVSTSDRRFASARTDIRDTKGSRLGFVQWLLRRGSGRLWRVVWYGAKQPPCRAAPASVRTDVFGSARCAG